MTSQFTYSASNNWTATSNGIVTLASGTRILSASICDHTEFNCTSQSVSYSVLAPSVLVTPDRDTAWVSGGAASVARFRVANTGSATTTYVLSGSECSNVGPCTLSSTSVALAPYDTAFVDVSYTAPASGTGQAKLRATAGSVSSIGAVHVIALPAPDPGFPGDSLSLLRRERDACLAVALGPGAAYECGDLRVVHALPAVRELNRAQAPTLVYNTASARPYPIVTERVSPRAGTAPDSIRAVVTMNGAAHTRRWAAWTAGTVRHLAVPVDATTLPTGVYPYTLQVTAHWNGGVSEVLHTRAGRLVVLNRTSSPFGAGWWLAGLEQLHHVGDTLKLWMGGDGSTRLYRSANSSGPWVADAFARADTLRKVGTEYVRTLPGNAEVYFSGTGEHLRTVNRLGDTTYFRWAAGRLSRIRLPRTTAMGADTSQFVFEYGNNTNTPSPRLSRVRSPWLTGYRDVSVTTDQNAHVTAISDPYLGALPPDTIARVRFGYSNGWMITRTDRRGAVQEFAYSSRRLRTSRRFPAVGDTILLTFIPAEARGVQNPEGLDAVRTQMNGPRGTVGGIAERVYWYVDRWGAPVRIAANSPAGVQNTYVERRDPRWPARVTRVVAPNGFTTTATYDARGNLAEQTAWNLYGDGRNATTTFAWDPRWDAVTRLTLPEGEVTLVQYDTVGRREWEQTGPSTSLRVRYEYLPRTHASAPGRLERVLYSGTGFERYEYDTRGNLQAAITTLGIRTEYDSDRIGRGVAVRRPISGSLVTIDSTYHDLRDRPLRAGTIAPAVGAADPQKAFVENEYDREGNLLAVARWSSPDEALVGVVRNEYRYDSIGRKVADVAPDGAVDSLFYDRGGNVVRIRSRRHAEIMAGLGAVADSMAYIRMRYDVQNRLVERIVPPVTYQPLDAGLALRSFIYPHETAYSDAHFPGRYRPPPYPWYPTETTGWTYRIPGDTIWFGYDPQTGTMTRADNRDARVRRSYYRNGALLGDTLVVRTVADLGSGGNMTSHVYGLEHRYDRSGSRTELKHPHQLAPSATQTHTYFHFDALTGMLRSVVDPLGNVYRVAYGGRGQVDTVRIPGGIDDIYRYDADGRLEGHALRNGSTAPSRWPQQWLRDAAISRDLRGKILEIANHQGLGDTLSTALYSGMGHLRAGVAKSVGIDGAGLVTDGYSSETAGYDALGNRHRSTAHTSYIVAGETRPRSASTSYHYFRYETGTGRLLAADTTGQYDAHTYDAAGNLRFMTQQRPFPSRSAPLRDRVYFYDATGQLRASEYREVSDPSMYEMSPYVRAFEEYRYDALGRRIWVRARRNCEPPYGITAECKLGKIRRTVWDGDAELYEIQMPGGDSHAQYWENDTQEMSLGWLGYGPWPSSIDPNPYFGRVAYVHGLSVDQPLGIIRIGYADLTDSARYSRPLRREVPFLVSPLWNERGQAHVGVFADGGLRRCATVSGYRRCVQILWPETWFAYHRPRAGIVAWHGSLLEDKQDATGTHYRRNRYYDPSTGRFTQEDPIGLAGGINLYGFAAGDPVSFEDPLGLKVCFRGSAQQVENLRRATEDAVGASVKLDAQNCISEVGKTNDRRLRGLRNRLALLAGIDDVINVYFATHPLDDPGDELAGNGYIGQSWTRMGRSCSNGGICVVIGSGWAVPYRRLSVGGVCLHLGPFGRTRPTLGNVVAHELVGHGFEFHAFGAGAMNLSEMYTIRQVDQLYQAARGMPSRCGH